MSGYPLSSMLLMYIGNLYFSLYAGQNKCRSLAQGGHSKSLGYVNYIISKWQLSLSMKESGKYGV